MASSTYTTVKSSRRPRRQRDRRRRWPLWAVLFLVFGSILIITAMAASAAIILHGRGLLDTAAVTEQDLQVSDVRLNRALVPGGTADLLFSVRNPNTYDARVDHVSLVGALRKAKPAGCSTKVAGPVTKPAGYRLPSAEQVLVGAGEKKNVVVHAAFTLAGSSKSGCGFTAEVDVSATQLPPTASPTTENPTTAPTSTPPAHDPPSSPTPPATVGTPTPDPTPPMTPPIIDCDAAVDPDCAVPPGSGGRGV